MTASHPNRKKNKMHVDFGEIDKNLFDFDDEEEQKEYKRQIRDDVEDSEGFEAQLGQDRNKSLDRLREMNNTTSYNPY
jgi:hypothetical protein